jgi:septum formation protein
MNDTTLTLASASPRRREILETLGLDFRVLTVEADETFSALPPEEEAAALAVRKLEAFRERYGSDDHPWILTADTIVEHRGRKFGKPGDAGEAEVFLRLLSGSTHRVITGLAFFSRVRGLTRSVTATEVDFAPLTEKEIRGYITTEEWRGVAGGYRIQERASLLISGIRGSYSNVMGLPIHTFYGMLNHHTYPFPWGKG